jgi:hypothetical protein
MDNDMKACYQKDYDFVHQIVKIPADLVAKTSSKDQRTILLQKELSKIIVKPGDYSLPTDAGIRIDGIDHLKSTTLQSAEHTPILVTFDCHKVADEYVDQSSASVKWTHSFKKALIFKTGDDVR